MIRFIDSDNSMGKSVDLQERVRLKTADRSELYSLTPPFPKSNFLMELSNACNHACIFCAHQKMQRKVGFMKKELAFDVLQQAYDLGTREVGFYATGEPFLIKDLHEYIKKAKEIGYTYVYLTANPMNSARNFLPKSVKLSMMSMLKNIFRILHQKSKKV